MDFRLCILFMTLLVDSHTQDYPKQCSISFARTEMQCRYDMACVDGVNTDRNWNSYDKNGNECSFYIRYQGYSLVPVYLVLKKPQLYVYEAVPTIYEPQFEEILNVIYSLDLSNNDYADTPVIKSMKNLAILNLSNNQLTTAHLSNENNLNKLTEIDLSHNAIRDIEVNTYSYPYITLKKINLSHNYLENIPDAVFCKIVNLQTLDLSHNSIESLSHFTFDGMKNVLHLNLSNNRLTDINYSLYRFSKLTVLGLSGNKIKELKVSDFEQLNKLEVLDLSSNSIKTIDYNVFQNMILLNNLDLSYNEFPIGLFKNKTIYNFLVGSNLLEGSLVRGMFEGVSVTLLDLSNQLLTAIEDYAFNDIVSLNTLFLNGNRIQSLSKMCFKTLTNLQILDLSNNEIVNIDFNKADLTKLLSLLLRNNRLIQIKYEYFQNLNSLEYLDLSENSISKFEPNSFQSLTSLINLKMSDNPFSGTLETDTFSGLISLPNLDISRYLLTTIKNASFNGMNKLKELNMSRSHIKELQYNIFAHTGSIETLDLSYNELELFCINLTELVWLRTLLLNNNNIKTISSTSVHGLSRLSKISLAYNALKNIHHESFSSLIDLRNLDLSYNEQFVFSEKILEKTKNLDSLYLSGIKTDINFAHIEDETISDLEISDADIDNVTALNLRELTHLSTVVLSNNNVSKLEIAAFAGVSTLRHLDLSFNKISFIQPGAFKDNELLYSLNISHNSLSMIGYGIFRGLIYLNTLDLSYNNIKDLQSERFYEVTSLSDLIVDHNRIESVNAEEFAGTRLTKLSIGDNPLSCRILVKLKQMGVPFQITAIIKDEHGGENIDGIKCNKDRVFEPTATFDKVTEKNDILVEIRNILYNVSNKDTLQNNKADDSLVSVKYLENMKDVIEKLNIDNNEKMSKVINLSNNTNLLLQRILNSLYDKPVVSTTPGPLIGDNKTVDFIISYINKVIEKELEKFIADEKQNSINERENKFSLTHYQTESPTRPSNEKLVSNNLGTKSILTETCVVLILLILVGLILYKFYKSRMFVRNRLSISTRELPGDMENSTL